MCVDSRKGNNDVHGSSTRVSTSFYISVIDGSQSKIFHDYRTSRFLKCLYTCYSETIPSSGLIQVSFLAARFQENGFVQGKVLGEHRGYEEGFKLGRQHGSRIGAEVSVC